MVAVDGPTTDKLECLIRWNRILVELILAQELLYFIKVSVVK